MFTFQYLFYQLIFHSMWPNFSSKGLILKIIYLSKYQLPNTYPPPPHPFPLESSIDGVQVSKILGKWVVPENIRTPPPPMVGHWKFQRDPEAEISKGYGGKNGNIFPGGPRPLSKGNLPRSHLWFSKSTNPWTPIYFSILKCKSHI